MKTLLFATLLTTGLMLGASAQEKEKIKERDVPTAVQTSFKTEFPNASNVEWRMKDATYKAKFKMNDMDHMASFDAAGKLMSKGMKIKESELPSAVASAVKGSYADRAIDEVYSVDKSGTMHYLVKLKGTPETKVLYTADGQVVKEKM